MIYLLLISFILSVVEGYREYNFYKINQLAGFGDAPADKTVKWINALTIIGVYSLGCYTFDSWYLLPSFLAIRLIVLDGVLNLKRGLNFWAVGSRDPFKILKGWEWEGKLLIAALAGGASYLIHYLK